MKDLLLLNSRSNEDKTTKTEINPTLLTQSTTLKVNVRLMGFNAIEFSVEGMRMKYFRNYVKKKFLMFSEDSERLTDAWVFISFITRNVKITERQLEWDETRRVWKCEFRDSGLLQTDALEYWIYVEKGSYGFYASEVVEMSGK